MSNKRYLEFDSTYRNRNCYPCPADFTTKITCTNTDTTGITAVDYVAKEYPTNSWYQAPFVGSDITGFANLDAINDTATSANLLTHESLQIPHMINGKTYTSLWPLDWMNGSSPTYFSQFVLPAATGPFRIGSGTASVGSATTIGTRFDGSTGVLINSPQNSDTVQRLQFWKSLLIRDQNILAPEKFSGGTASAPQLGPKAIQQGIVNEYFAGGVLFRFSSNPLLDINTITDGASEATTPWTLTAGGPILGSLGFPFYYQRISFAAPPPVQLIIGSELTAGPAIGYIACIISQQEIIVRLGPYQPIKSTLGLGLGNNLFPGVPVTLQTDPLVGDPNPILVTFNTLLSVTLRYPTAVGTSAAAWGIPSSVSDNFPAYFWCGSVESAVIQTYNSSSGKVTLDSSFNSGTDGFNSATDYYIIDFNTDPTGQWKDVESGKPRLFFPTGALIPNFYSGIELTNISREELSAADSRTAAASVTSYDVSRRVLYINQSIQPRVPAHRDEAAIGLAICTLYTVVFLQRPLGAAIPEGSFIAWRWPAQIGNEIVYYVTVDAPQGATSIVINGQLNPAALILPWDPLLEMHGASSATYVSVPPYSDPDVVAYWNNTVNWPELNPDPNFPLNVAGLSGAQTILARGKTKIDLAQEMIPFIPGQSFSIPGASSVILRQNGVLELSVTFGGLGYKITDKKMPILALISPPENNSWNALGPTPFSGMKPFPENFIGAAGVTERIWTFMNLCFVNIESVGPGGEVLSLSINNPGSGYPRGSRVFLIDGTGLDISLSPIPSTAQWTPGPGSGALATVVQSGQILAVAGGRNFPPRSDPVPGSLAYLMTYGWGLSETEKTIFNSAPDIGSFIINYSGLESDPQNLGFSVVNGDIPREIQNCIATNSGTLNAQDTINLKTTYPETGTRLITHAWRSINNQVLIGSPRPFPQIGATGYHKFQYAAPGQYTGGSWEIPANHSLATIIIGDNNILWLGLEKPFDISNCVGKYSFTRGTFVLPDYSWGDGTVGGTPAVPTPPPPSGVFTNVKWADHRFEAMGPKTGSLAGAEGTLPLPNSLTGNWLEILSFAKDNEVPLNYTGSTVSQNQMVCYEVELISLILPNLPLDNTLGGLIAFYPYLYVELSNVSSPSGGTPGIIYSNNPNAHKALFRVAIDDTPTPTISKFIKVDGDGTVQTVKFKPNDNLHFRVYLQNGTLFATQEKDTAPPADPDPFVQISAEFSIRRLS